MVLKISRMLLMLAVATLIAWALGPDACHEAQAAHVYAPNLFQNYYVPPVGDGSVGAQLYLSPRPTPPRVGHTYVTYQPLMPHEFLYQHSRCYLRQNDCAGWTKTWACWEHDWLGDHLPFCH